jgi:hypothetical protein
MHFSQALPLELEPGSESIRIRFEFLIELARRNKTYLSYFCRIGLRAVIGPAQKYVTELMLRTEFAERRLVGEMVNMLEAAGGVQFVFETSRCGNLEGLAAPWMAATAVRPVEGPQSLAGRPLLQQQFAIGIEQEYGERAMQHPTVIVAFSFAQMADFVVILVDKDECFVVRGFPSH